VRCQRPHEPEDRAKAALSFARSIRNGLPRKEPPIARAVKDQALTVATAQRQRRVLEAAFRIGAEWSWRFWEVVRDLTASGGGDRPTPGSRQALQGTPGTPGRGVARVQAGGRTGGDGTGAARRRPGVGRRLRSDRRGGQGHLAPARGGTRAEAAPANRPAVASGAVQGRPSPRREAANQLVGPARRSAGGGLPPSSGAPVRATGFAASASAPALRWHDLSFQRSRPGEPSLRTLLRVSRHLRSRRGNAVRAKGRTRVLVWYLKAQPTLTRVNARKDWSAQVADVPRLR
jgi:hypothetical protein